jgi:hypothetical protein
MRSAANGRKNLESMKPEKRGCKNASLGFLVSKSLQIFSLSPFPIRAIRVIRG